MKRGLGQAILNGIIKESLITLECHDNVSIIIWNAMSAEVLEAIVSDFNDDSKVKLCSECKSFVLLYEIVDNKYICCDCLPPIKE